MWEVLHVHLLKLTRLPGCILGVQNVLWPDLRCAEDGSGGSKEMGALQLLEYHIIGEEGGY